MCMREGYYENKYHAWDYNRPVMLCVYSHILKSFCYFILNFMNAFAQNDKNTLFNKNFGICGANHWDEKQFQDV